MFVFDEHDNILITNMERFKTVPKFPKIAYDPRFTEEDMMDFAVYCSEQRMIEDVKPHGKLWVPRKYNNALHFHAVSSESMLKTWISVNNRWKPLTEIRPDAVTIEVVYHPQPGKHLDIRGHIVTNEDKVINIIKLHFNNPTQSHE